MNLSLRRQIKTICHLNLTAEEELDSMWWKPELLRKHQGKMEPPQNRHKHRPTSELSGIFIKFYPNDQIIYQTKDPQSRHIAGGSSWQQDRQTETWDSVLSLFIGQKHKLQAVLKFTNYHLICLEGNRVKMRCYHLYGPVSTANISVHFN